MVHQALNLGTRLRSVVFSELSLFSEKVELYVTNMATPLTTHSFSVFCFLVHAWPTVVRDRQERLHRNKALEGLACFTHWTENK